MMYEFMVFTVVFVHFIFIASLAAFLFVKAIDWVWHKFFW